MQDPYSQLITRLDYLVAFIEVSKKDVFNLIQSHSVYGITIGYIYEEDHNIYENQILFSSLLLGYSYFEAYLTEIIKLSITKRIPPDKSINIEKECNKIIQKSLSDKLNFMYNKLHIRWNREIDQDLFVISRMRNCCLHNNFIVNNQLGEDSRFTIGDKIVVTPELIHS